MEAGTRLGPYEIRAQLEHWEASLPDPIWTSAPMWREHSLLRYDQTIVETYRRR